MIRWTYFESADLSERDLGRFCDWARANDLDPGRIPHDSRIGHDTDTDEFIVDYYERPWRIVGDRPARIRIRRRRLAWMDFS